MSVIWKTKTIWWKMWWWPNSLISDKSWALWIGSMRWWSVSDHSRSEGRSKWDEPSSELRSDDQVGELMVSVVGGMVGGGEEMRGGRGDEAWVIASVLGDGTMFPETQSDGQQDHPSTVTLSCHNSTSSLQEEDLISQAPSTVSSFSSTLNHFPKNENPPPARAKKTIFGPQQVALAHQKNFAYTTNPKIRYQARIHK